MFYLKAEAHANSCCIRNLSPLRHRLVVSRGTKGPWRQWRRNVWPAGAHHVDTGHRAHDHEGRSLNSWATDTDLCTAVLLSSPCKCASLCSRLAFFCRPYVLLSHKHNIHWSEVSNMGRLWFSS
jgi:hypothetical protein